MKSHPFKHLRTITKHRHQVIRNAFHFGIFFHALKHDLTKYGWREFHLSAKYYAGFRSPVFEERIRNNYFSLICQHHTKRNPHHWEYWTDYLQGRILIKQMPYKYAVEYVCDVLAATKTYDPEHYKPENGYNYFLARVDRYYMAKGTRKFIKWLFEQYIKYGNKGVKRKITKKAYQEITSQYPNVEVIDGPYNGGELPELLSEE